MHIEERLRVLPGARFRLADRDPADKLGLDKQAAPSLFAQQLEQLDVLQERLYAEGRRALLVVFQAMDAAGKDGTIEHVMRGVNPQGVRVTSFKEPTHLELAHAFLWRCSKALPGHSEIGIFNRSHYEEVLVVRVHPEYLAAQGIDPAAGRRSGFWKQRLEDISAWELHVSRSGTRIIKFFLHLSKEEQRRRFLARATTDEKNWKFSPADIREREHWDAYQAAYQAALRATSSDHAPWYVIPADHKWLMRTAVAAIMVHHLEAMDPRFPVPSPDELAAMDEAVRALQAEG